ncbi:hypothetical protein M075_4490 [Bacteroides fragilis str. 20793-3]|nr:hypothetical protein M075_4490 [Bacteroides fragilis str. 20793-3]
MGTKETKKSRTKYSNDVFQFNQYPESYISSGGISFRSR